MQVVLIFPWYISLHCYWQNLTKSMLIMVKCSWIWPPSFWTPDVLQQINPTIRTAQALCIHFFSRPCTTTALFHTTFTVSGPGIITSTLTSQLETLVTSTVGNGWWDVLCLKCDLCNVPKWMNLRDFWWRRSCKWKICGKGIKKILRYGLKTW